MLKPKILLLGSSGQLGQTLVSHYIQDYDLQEINRPELNFLHKQQLRKVILRIKPEVIINASAFTEVDLAEKNRQEAFVVNSDGPALLGEITKELGSLLVHFSTDYVFDGLKKGHYLETDECKPLNVYGESKRLGEIAILDSGCKNIIIRTSWVYSHLRENFLISILKLALLEKSIKVIDDQIGSPTSTEQISCISSEFVKSYLKGNELELGLFHFSASGETSWYGFAKEIINQAEECNFILTLTEKGIIPISSDEYSSVAVRPKNSLLNSYKLRTYLDVDLLNWQSALKKVMNRIDFNNS